MRDLAGTPQGGGVRSGGWKIDGERAPEAGDGTDAHPAAVRVGDPLDRGQPEADAWLAAVRTPHVGLEGLIAELGRQAWAIVFDLDPDAPGMTLRDRPRAHDDPWGRDAARIFDGVAQ